MVIGIFYAICGLAILFFAFFFLQVCRLASRKAMSPATPLPADSVFNSAQISRQLAQWESEMAQFTARHGRSAARLILIATSSAALLGSAVPSPRSISRNARVNQRAFYALHRGSSPDRSQAGQSLCQKS